MKVKNLKELLADFPDDASVELTKIMTIDMEKEEGFMLRLDFPIIGAALDKETNDLLLVTETDKDNKMIKQFGKLTPIPLKEVADEEAQNKTTH